MPCTMQTERAETQPVGGLGWEMGGPPWEHRQEPPCWSCRLFLGLYGGPPTCIAAVSIGGWLLLCVDYSLKCLLSPMPLHTAEIPFPSNEVSAGVLERRKAFN